MPYIYTLHLSSPRGSHVKSGLLFPDLSAIKSTCVYMKMEKWRLQEREQGIRALAAWKTGHKQEFKVEYPKDILRLV